MPPSRTISIGAHSVVVFFSLFDELEQFYECHCVVIFYDIDKLLPIDTDHRVIPRGICFARGRLINSRTIVGRRGLGNPDGATLKRNHVILRNYV